MPSETESLAVQLVRALSDAPDGRPMQWHMIEHLDGATADVVEFAAARGWVQVEASHIALTRSRPTTRKGSRQDLGKAALGAQGVNILCVPLISQNGPSSALRVGS
jgi:hypothetical protein